MGIALNTGEKWWKLPHISCLSGEKTQSPRGPKCYNGIEPQLITVTTCSSIRNVLASFYSSFTYPFLYCASWDHFWNKLFALKSFTQGLLLGKPKPREYISLSVVLPLIFHTFYQRSIFGKITMAIIKRYIGFGMKKEVTHQFYHIVIW